MPNRHGKKKLATDMLSRPEQILTGLRTISPILVIEVTQMDRKERQREILAKKHFTCGIT